MECPFCNPDPFRVFHAGDPEFICLWDGFAVSPGHALVVPRRHVAMWFDASLDEQVALLRGIEIAKKAIEARHAPDGFNIGVNVGTAAGQTVPHLHVHVIPRYTGDVPDPRGGVRYVIPEKANYLLVREASAQYLASPAADSSEVVSGTPAAPLLHALKQDLAAAAQVDIAVAFVLETGLVQLEPYLVEVLQSGGRVRLLTGDYMDVTEPQALLRLLDLRSQLIAAAPPESTCPLDLRVFEEFEGLLAHPQAVRLDQAWVERYRQRRRPPCAGITPFRDGSGRRAFAAAPDPAKLFFRKNINTRANSLHPIDCNG